MPLWASLVVSLAAFVWLAFVLRRQGHSLGLPIAYLVGLMLIHAPGAYAHLVHEHVLQESEITVRGMSIAAVAALAFVFGVQLVVARRITIPLVDAPRKDFVLFCLFAGWFLVYGLAFLHSIPSIGAAIQKGGAIWMLGVLLGLRSAIAHGNVPWIAMWGAALAVYPILMLLMGGFLSYGTAAIIGVLSVLVVSTKSPWRVALGTAIASYVALSVFISYFQNRSEIRSAVWGGSAMDERIDKSLQMFTEFQWVDTSDPMHLLSLDLRLNQNHFVGLAATRLQNGDVDFLHGQTVWEGFLAMIPRLIWPDKPVVSGSPRIVSEMTGLPLSEGSSFGVGNVMEFYINGGMLMVVGGFVALGAFLAWLDRKAAIAERTGDFGALIIFYLPAIAIIQPGGSFVDMMGAGAAAAAAAYAWVLLWTRRARRLKSQHEAFRFVPRARL